MHSQIIESMKAKGIFDRFRKDCIADVDTKPAYINLHQSVNKSVTDYLSQINWSSKLVRISVREGMRKHIVGSSYFDKGVDRIVNQTVDPKIQTAFLPIVENFVYEHLGIQKPKQGELAPIEDDKTCMNEEMDIDAPDEEDLIIQPPDESTNSKDLEEEEKYIDYPKDEHVVVEEEEAVPNLNNSLNVQQLVDQENIATSDFTTNSKDEYLHYNDRVRSQSTIASYSEDQDDDSGEKDLIIVDEKEEMEEDDDEDDQESSGVKETYPDDDVDTEEESPPFESICVTSPPHTFPSAALFNFSPPRASTGNDDTNETLTTTENIDKDQQVSYDSSDKKHGEISKSYNSPEKERRTSSHSTSDRKSSYSSSHKHSSSSSSHSRDKDKSSHRHSSTSHSKSKDDDRHGKDSRTEKYSSSSSSRHSSSRKYSSSDKRSDYKHSRKSSSGGTKVSDNNNSSKYSNSSHSQSSSSGSSLKTSSSSKDSKPTSSSHHHRESSSSRSHSTSKKEDYKSSSRRSSKVSDSNSSSRSGGRDHKTSSSSSRLKSSSDEKDKTSPNQGEENDEKVNYELKSYEETKENEVALQTTLTNELSVTNEVVTTIHEPSTPNEQMTIIEPPVPTNELVNTNQVLTNEPTTREPSPETEKSPSPEREKSPSPERERSISPEREKSPSHSITIDSVESTSQHEEHEEHDVPMDASSSPIVVDLTEDESPLMMDTSIVSASDEFNESNPQSGDEMEAIATTNNKFNGTCTPSFTLSVPPDMEHVHIVNSSAVRFLDTEISSEKQAVLSQYLDPLFDDRNVPMQENPEPDTKVSIILDNCKINDNIRSWLQSKGAVVSFDGCDFRRCF